MINPELEKLHPEEMQVLPTYIFAWAYQQRGGRLLFHNDCFGNRNYGVLMTLASVKVSKILEQFDALRRALMRRR